MRLAGDGVRGGGDRSPGGAAQDAVPEDVHTTGTVQCDAIDDPGTFDACDWMQELAEDHCLY